MTLEQAQKWLAISVPEAASLLGLSRSAAYAAAASGQLPTKSFGRRKVVPVKALLALMEDAA